jgi:hypothetical protein
MPPDGTQVTQKNEKELSDIARSILALFGGQVDAETTATVPSDGAAEDTVDVGSALGLESMLDINPPGYTAPPPRESGATPVSPVDVEEAEGSDAAGRSGTLNPLPPSRKKGRAGGA